jgi:hypothetical protein
MASLAERYKRAKGVNRPASSSDRDKGTSEAGSLLRAFLLKPDDIGKWGKAFAKDDQKATLKDLVGMREQDRTNLAKGGEVESDTQQGHETNEQEDDIVSRIMNKFYSHGGKIADKTKISSEKQLDFPKDDLVSRIMKKRAKKC